jgi:uncharacterized protein (TIGR03067 family)
MKTLLASVVLFAAAFANAQENNDELEQMQGTWLVVSLTEEGKVVPAKEIEILEMIIAKDVFTVFEKEKMVVQDRIKLDPTKKPKEIDFTHLVGDDKGKTEPGIYVFEKDQLKICLNEKGKDRPTVFEGKETEAYSVIVLKKKPK